MQDKPNDKPTEEISRILADLIRTIKVVSVYPENNPLPAKLKETFIERFINLINENNGLSFKIISGEILFQAKCVYKDRLPDDNLAGLFHNAGITEISFSPAFEFKEGQQFFKVLKNFMNREEGEDLIGLLWQSNIRGFEYTTLEDVMLGQYDEEFISRESISDSDAFVLGDHTESGKIQYAQIFLNDEEEQENKESDSESSGSMTPKQLAEKEMGLMPVPDKGEISLPDTALILNESYQLGESEFNQVQNILEEDAQFNFCETIVELIREMLLQESEYSGFSETMTITERIHSELIHLGKISHASRLLGILREIDSLLGKNSVRWKERIHESLVMTGGWENLSRLSLALNGHQEIQSQDIKEYLSNFKWEALSAIMDMLGALEHRDHRLAVVDYMSTTGTEHIDIIAKGIYDRRWYVVRNTACILGKIGNEKAISYLGKAIKHEEPRVRLEVLKGITQNEDIKDVSLLFKLVWDEAHLIRKEVLRVVLNSSSEERLTIIVNIINDSRFISLEQSDQERLVLAYSRLAGEHSVNFLKTLVSGLKSANNELKGFYQNLAFKALSTNSSEKAEKTLKELSRSWKGKVRNLANEALKRRQEYMEKGSGVSAE